MWSMALFAVFFYSLALAFGDIVSTKTKGIFSSILMVGIIYVIGYFTGIVPRDTIQTSGLLSIIGTFGMLAIVTNLGTMIKLNQLIEEWKTVVLCLAGLVVLAAVLYLVGVPLFGFDYAMTALPPIAGGGVAATMLSEASNAAGRPELGSFAWLVSTLQLFIGIPLASIILQHYCRKLIKSDEFAQYQLGSSKMNLHINMKIIPSIPSKYNTPNVMMMKLLAVTLLSQLVANVTGLPAAIMCLVFGVLFYELGFLDSNCLQNAGMYNLIVFCMMAAAPSSFAALSADTIGTMLLMAVVFLLIGAGGLILGGVIMGKIMKIDTSFAAALALNAMFGFPFNLMITEDIIRTSGLSEEDGAKLREIVLPKMIVAGFTTVTVASVAIAGIVIPMIFG